MKNIIFYLLLWLAGLSASAQDSLRTVVLPAGTTLHIVSPQPIQYVDISGKQLIGDLALPNVLRIRQRDSVTRFDSAVITIAGEDFLAQYRLLPGKGEQAPMIAIEPKDMLPLPMSKSGYNQSQLRAMALNIISRRPGRHREKVKAHDIVGLVNNVYTIDDYIFLDLSFHNRSRLRYDIDGFRFKVSDRKVTRATNVQSQEIEPVFVLDGRSSFGKAYRNVFVFRKMSLPDNKVLEAELSEKQLSGRTLTLQVSYKDILRADNLPN